MGPQDAKTDLSVSPRRAATSQWQSHFAKGTQIFCGELGIIVYEDLPHAAVGSPSDRQGKYIVSVLHEVC